MKRTVLIILLVAVSHGAYANDWVFRMTEAGILQPSQQGTLSRLGPDTLVQQQQAGKPLSIQIIAFGMGRCENGVLSGSGVLENIHMPFIQVLNGVALSSRRISCGETVLFDAPNNVQLSGIKAIPDTGKAFKIPLSASINGQRIQLGRVSFLGKEGDIVSSDIFIDLASVQAEVAILDARFASPAVSFGEIDSLSDTKKSTRLEVSKTQYAGTEAINYTLTFESSQIRDNSFQLKSTSSESYFPYQIKIGDVSLTPGNKYTRSVPSGSNTKDIIDLDFYLQGKNLKGLYAGTRLNDTLTAVITPTS